MKEINSDECGFTAFRVNWPKYTKSVFMNKVEIVTDGRGTITGVTNPEKLLWAKIPSSAEDIQILEIGKEAFSACTKLREITFADNLEIIGENAFRSCSRLISVSLPDKLYSIGEGAFEKTALKSFVFPSAVDCVPSRIFMDDRNLEGVVLHRNIKRIGILAFAGCTALRTIEIPSSVREISEGSFMSSGLRTLYLPHSVSVIGNSALSSCRFLEAVFYDGTESDFRRISFGKNWNRGMNESCALYIRDGKGVWYNAFSSSRKAAHQEENVRRALSLFDFESLPSESELSSAFRKKAMAFHPDRLSGLELDSEYTRFAEEKFRQYKDAYNLLLPYCRKVR